MRRRYAPHVREPAIEDALAAACLLLLVPGCLPDNPSLEDDETGETETGAPDEYPEAGLLGCPTGERCLLLAVSETLDDRVEVFSIAGPGPTYRGALDLDLKPNDNGDISGEALDEPYGLAWLDGSLHVLLGHYPTRVEGSLLSVPASSVAEVGEGELLASSAWFDSIMGTTSGGFELRPLERLEPLTLSAGAERLHAGVFANDLFVPEDLWTNPSELLTLDPAASAQPSTTALGCTGAWTQALLDDAGERLAIACDGDEGVVIVDVSGATPTLECSADIPFSAKRVRYLAPDGLGGVIVAESPAIVSASEDARLWWFDGECESRGFSTFDAALSWDLRELALLPDTGAPRWLAARADTDQRGVLVLAGDPASGTIEQCNRLQALDDEGAWLAAGGDEPLQPHALRVSAEGVAIGAGPATYDEAGPGWGKVLWVELDGSDDPCTGSVSSWVDLSESAPAVDTLVPQTWRRAPHVLELIEVQR